MIFLGEFKAATIVFYAANFHNDTGTLEDPTSPEAQIRNPAGTWSALTAPTKQNTKTGHYGGAVDTTGYSAGQHVIWMAGIVATAKTVATEFCFTIVANIESDTYARLGAPAGTSVSSDVAAVKTDTGNIGTAGAGLTSLGDTRLANLDATVSSRSTLTAAGVWGYATRELTSFGTLVADIWAHSARTLTAFSTTLAASVWDVLESAIATASSIGLKVKTNVDNTISSRLASASYTAPDNAGITYILAESQSHPTLAEIEATTVLAKEATVAAVKAKTDNLPSDPASNTQVNTRLATSGYVAPDNTSITEIKAKTDTIVWLDITDIKDGALGKWSINKSTNVLTMYKADGVTVLKTFNLTDNASVSERVPV